MFRATIDAGYRVDVASILKPFEEPAWLELLEAEPLLKQFEGQPLSRVWQECERGDWLALLALGVAPVHGDRKALVRAAMTFADASMRHVPIDVAEPRALRHGLEAWLAGELPDEELGRLQTETLEAAERVASSARFGPDLREHAAAACRAITAASAIAVRDLSEERKQTMAMVALTLRQAAEACAWLSASCDTDPVGLSEERIRARARLRVLDAAIARRAQLEELAQQLRRQLPLGPATR